DAAEALAGCVVFGAAVRVGAVDRLETRVKVVDVQDGEGEVGLRRGRKARRYRKRRGGAQQDSFHIPVLSLESVVFGILLFTALRGCNCTVLPFSACRNYGADGE